MRARRARPPELFSPQAAQGSIVPFTEPVKRMVAVLDPSAEETRGKVMKDKKNNPKSNRFM